MADRSCPRCGAAVPHGLKFCRECGSRTEDLSGFPAPPDGGGDETLVAAAPHGFVAPPPPPSLDDERTMVAGGFRGPLPARAAPPEPGTGPAFEAEPATADLRPAAPPPWETPRPAPPPPPEPEPVSDDFDLGDDSSGATLAANVAPPTLEYAGAPGAASAPVWPPPPAPAAPPPPLPPAVEGALRLEHWSPKVKGEVVALEGDETVVGRDRGGLTYPDDAFLSRKHARFFRDGEGRMCVEDLGTLNGTYLRIRVPVKLDHRDVILLGRHVFRFELLQYDEKDDRTIEGDPLTRVQGVQGTAPRARLVKRQEEGFSGMPFFFGVQRYVLGRTDGTHNFQRDDRLSRRHASLSYRDGDYWLEDLGSQNGTFLRLRGPRVLEGGDVVLTGDQYFRVL